MLDENTQRSAGVTRITPADTPLPNGVFQFFEMSSSWGIDLNPYKFMCKTSITFVTPSTDDQESTFNT